MTEVNVTRKEGFALPEPDGQTFRWYADYQRPPSN